MLYKYHCNRKVTLPPTIRDNLKRIVASFKASWKQKKNIGWRLDQIFKQMYYPQILVVSDSVHWRGWKRKLSFIPERLIVWNNVCSKFQLVRLTSYNIFSCKSKKCSWAAPSSSKIWYARIFMTSIHICHKTYACFRKVEHYLMIMRKIADFWQLTRKNIIVC